MNIGLLLYPGCMPAGLLAFADLLHGANRHAGRELFHPQYVALASGPVRCAHGVLLNAEAGLEQTPLDGLLIPGFWAESAAEVSATLAASGELLQALARQRGPQLWSYCTGVVLLAASGQLQGRAATLTWWLLEPMLQQFPEVDWRSERTWVFDRGVATASGVGGYLPIAQELIQRHLGAERMQQLNQLLVLPRPVQPHPVFAALSLIQQDSPWLRRLQLWVEQTPAEQATVARLALAMGVSERSLARRVRLEQGQAVGTWMRLVKLNQVSERLLFSTLSVSQISAALGFSSDSNLSRMFKQQTGLAPLPYRQRYGAAG
ncbi:MAG: helix-turn-helix domain-containing protein [Candidatus Pseudomonas colombiensis]|jgi:transcriptional regulator GlxA family with amidase domain|nr:MAG: helix-turn-helix domain-containing protein [Pseudomonas sp.]